MSVAVSPDGRTLAVDLQGSIWTMPAAGGAATRITDVFNDARQPAWSPDGKWITFFGYRDGGYDIWAVAPGRHGQQKLTWGPFDDREPVWSHDGTRVAFSSDRGNPLGSDYNIWILDVAQRRAEAADEGAVRGLHADLVARRQGDCLRVHARERPVGVGGDRGDRHRAEGGDRQRPRRRAVVGTGRRRSSTTRTAAGPEPRTRWTARPITGSENVFAFRASWASPTEFFTFPTARSASGRSAAGAARRWRSPRRCR